MADRFNHHSGNCRHYANRTFYDHHTAEAGAGVGGGEDGEGGEGDEGDEGDEGNEGDLANGHRGEDEGGRGGSTFNGGGAGGSGKETSTRGGGNILPGADETDRTDRTDGPDGAGGSYDGSHFMVRADSAYSPGAQVYLCYSHVTSAQLLSQYGFVEDPHAVAFPRDNPAERVELSPGPPVTDIDFGLRVEVRQPR
jgi:hypothetical protein